MFLSYILVCIYKKINKISLQVTRRSRNCGDTCCQWHCKLLLLYQGLHWTKSSSKTQQGQLYQWVHRSPAYKENMIIAICLANNAWTPQYNTFAGNPIQLQTGQDMTNL
jgi:hypothetical protein